VNPLRWNRLVALLAALVVMPLAVAAAQPVIALFQIIPGDGWLVMVLNLVLDVGLPVLGTYLFTELTKFVLKAQAWDAFQKRVLVFVWGLVIAGLNQVLGLQLPEVFGALSQPELQMLLTTGLTYIAHKLLNQGKSGNPRTR